MRHLLALAAAYAVIVALVLPGSLLAQESIEGTVTETTPAEPAPAEPAPAEPAPAAPAPAPAQPAPAPAPQPEAAAEPEPQFLADERDEAKPKPDARAAASGSVTIVDFSFGPGTITVNQGDSVTWVNDGPTAHSATSTSGAFDTGVFPAGQSRSHTFTEAGTFSYICTPHPNMRGTVVVQAAQTGGGDGGSGGETGGTTGTTAGTTGAEAAQADGGPALPNSGADSGALLLLGGLMLLLGVAVHRRARAAEPRPAGRIGW
jgi:LPXTG-motif cell wall-anchored protein